jgi:hypothetical protein
MIAALIALAALAAPAPAAHPSAPTPQQDEPAIRVSLNSNGRYQRGDKVKVQVRTRDDGYLIVLHVDTDRRLRVLFPLDPSDDNFVRGGQKYDVIGRGDRETFRVDTRSGDGLIYAAVSRDPYRLNEFEVGDHWDFRALNDVRLGDDLEADLNDFVRRIASRDFDYDLQRYDVYERVAYASTTYVTDVYYGPSWRSPYWANYYDDWCFGYWGCGWGGGSRIFVGVSFGSPYWYGYPRYYGDPYWYDPWFYSPIYYRPPFAHYPYPYYGSPYRPRRPGVGPYPYDYYHGGYYTSPWRRRDPRFGTSTYAGAMGTFGGSYVPGRLASGLAGRDGTWRDRADAGASVVGVNGSTYTAPRRAVDGRAHPGPVDMTPSRGEGRRAAPGVVTAPSDGRPQARPAEGGRERRRTGSDELPRRVGPVGEPRRMDNGPASAPRIVNPGDRADLSDDSRAPRGGRQVDDGYELPRVIEPSSGRRTIEARPAEPRDAGPRDVNPRDVGPRDAGRDGASRDADARDVDPRRVDRSSDRREMDRGRDTDRGGHDRPAPQAEHGHRESPPPRSAPAPRGDGAGGSRRPSPRR